MGTLGPHGDQLQWAKPSMPHRATRGKLTHLVPRPDTGLPIPQDPHPHHSLGVSISLPRLGKQVCFSLKSSRKAQTGREDSIALSTATLRQVSVLRVPPTDAAPAPHPPWESGLPTPIPSVKGSHMRGIGMLFLVGCYFGFKWKSAVGCSMICFRQFIRSNRIGASPPIRTLDSSP